jgi:hypothetical protein
MFIIKFKGNINIYYKALFKEKPIHLLLGLLVCRVLFSAGGCKGVGCTDATYLGGRRKGVENITQK